MSRLLKRRSFLQAMGVGAGLMSRPFHLLLANILGGQIYSHASAGEPRRFLHFQNSGAPPRWVFDLFLTPYSAENFTPNPMVGTKYVSSGGRYTSMEYQTVLRKGLQVPHLWQFEVPAIVGNRPLDSLLDNMLSIQGVATSNAHEQAQQYLYHPPGASQSIPALSADASNAFVKAVNLSVPQFQFVSAKNTSPVLLQNGGNVLEKLAQPFQRAASSSFLSLKSQLAAEIDQVALHLSKVSKNRDPVADIVHETRKTAADLMESSFLDVQVYWTAAVSKYQDLITRAIDVTVPLSGLTDQPIGTVGSRDGDYQVIQSVANNLDLRSMFQSDTTISRMAEDFAVVEYLATKDYSRSVCVSPGPLDKVYVNGSPIKFGFDEHETGKMPSLIANSLYFRAFGACLLELIDQLKGAQIFDDTIIDLAGEFNRSPRNDGSGSDHANYANRTLFSGVFGSPLVIGDTLGSSSDPLRLGSWGDGGQISSSQLAATLALLLKTPSPVVDGEAILTLSNGQYQSKLSASKLV